MEWKEVGRSYLLFQGKSILNLIKGMGDLAFHTFNISLKTIIIFLGIS